MMNVSSKTIMIYIYFSNLDYRLLVLSAIGDSYIRVNVLRILIMSTRVCYQFESSD